MIGSCGGRLRTGSYLDYRTDFTRNRWSEFIGTSYNWVLVTCMLAMGLEPDDWERNGEPGYGDMRGQPFNTTPLDQIRFKSNERRAFSAGDRPSIRPP
jgi:hypothetical protein